MMKRILTILIPMLVVATSVLTSATVAADSIGASSATPAVKAEFKKLCSKRQQIVRRLARLDDQAAQAVAAGEDAVELHADQTAAQDELDLIQLRLESMAIRYTIPLPSMPTPGEVGTADVQAEQRARAMFRAGEERTHRLIARRTHRLLARLDFSSILAP